MNQNGLYLNSKNSFYKANVLTESKMNINKSFSNKSNISLNKSLIFSNKGVKQLNKLKYIPTVIYKNRSRTPINTNSHSMEDITQNNLELQKNVNKYKIQIFKYKKQISDLEKEVKDQLKQIEILLNDNQLVINDKKVFDNVYENYIIFSLKQQHREDLKVIDGLKDEIELLKKNIRLTTKNEKETENEIIMREFVKLKKLYDNASLRLQEWTNNQVEVSLLKEENSKKDFMIINLSEQLTSKKKLIFDNEKYIQELISLITKQKNENKFVKNKIKNSYSICQKILTNKFIEYQGENNDISELLSEKLYNKIIFILTKNFESKNLTFNHIQAKILNNIKYETTIGESLLIKTYQQLSDGLINLFKGLKFNDYFYVRSFVKSFLYYNFIVKNCIINKETIDTKFRESFNLFSSHKNNYRVLERDKRIYELIDILIKKAKEIDYKSKGIITYNELILLCKTKIVNNIMKEQAKEIINYLVYLMKQKKQNLGLFELNYNIIMNKQILKNNNTFNTNVNEEVGNEYDQNEFIIDVNDILLKIKNKLDERGLNINDCYNKEKEILNFKELTDFITITLNIQLTDENIKDLYSKYAIEPINNKESYPFNNNVNLLQILKDIRDIEKKNNDNLVEEIKLYLEKEQMDFNSFIISIINQENKKVPLENFKILLDKRKIKYNIQKISNYNFIHDNIVDIDLLEKEIYPKDNIIELPSKSESKSSIKENTKDEIKIEDSIEDIENEIN